MQQIELTDKQKEQLLEMCNKLFSKQKQKFQLDKRTDTFDDEIIFIRCYKSTGKHSIRVLFTISWYEFVNTYLAEKILNPDPKKSCRNLKQKFCDFFWNNNIYWYYCQEGSLPLSGNPKILHPVDYLYEQFKLLKLK